MGLLEALFLSHLEPLDPARTGLLLDLDRRQVAELAPGQPEGRVTAKLGRPDSWWLSRQGIYLFSRCGLQVNCHDGVIDMITAAVDPEVGFHAARPYSHFQGEVLFQDRVLAAPPSLQDVERVFPEGAQGVEIERDEDEVVVTLLPEGAKIGCDLDFTLGGDLQAVAFYLQ